MVVNYGYSSPSHQAKVQIESNFASGMVYNNTPLAQGGLRNLVNLDVVDNGTALKARAGMDTIVEDIASFPNLDIDSDVVIHHCDVAYVEHYHTAANDAPDASVCRYAIIGTTDNTGCFKWDDNVRIAVRYNNTTIYGTEKKDWRTGKTVKSVMSPSHKEIHSMTIAKPNRTGFFTTYDNNCYMTINYGDVNKIGILYMMFNAAKDGFTWEIKFLNPKDITTQQAVNYGYNMLLDDPYDFKNMAYSGAIPNLNGILPYDTSNNLVMSCRAGTQLKFKAIYQYPTTSSDTYMAMWTIYNNDNPNDTGTVLQSITKSPIYNPGQEISIVTEQTSYTNFTLTVTLYSYTEYLKYKDVSEALLPVKLAPLTTMSTSFSYTTAESNATTLNLAANKYDLGTAEGMTTWQGRLVLWGVKGCKNTLWVSEINQPDYFPYPNNVDIFNTDIVCCCKYKDKLLVFTQDTLYQLAFAEDGLTYRHTVVQDRMIMEREDQSTIIPMQNMVFFKNANYYYMMVPGKYGTNQYGELTLAPITKPIENIFDNFQKYTQDLVGVSTIHDWWCYMEGCMFRICYKMKTHDGYIDIVFQYDTKVRTWNIYTYELGDLRGVQWISSITSDSIFIQPFRLGLTVSCDLLQVNPATCIDDTRLTNSCPVGIIDTGYRDMMPMVKKKFRGIQFSVTNEDDPFIINPLFYLDNEIRFNDHTDYVEEGTTYVDGYFNDTAVEHGPSIDFISEGRENWNTEFVNMHFTGKGRIPRLVLQTKFSAHRTVIKNLSWVYRDLSARGGNNGEYNSR